MTYNASVPVAGSSPGLFPSQANANFARLQTLLGADHQFNNSAAANDGYHKLVHMDIPNPLPTGALPSTGRLYVKTNSGLVQLFYMDSAGTEYQLTPQSSTEVSKIVGSASLGSNGTISAFNPSYDYTGYGVVFINGSNVQRTYNFMKSGGNVDIHELDDNTGGVSRPTLFYTGTDLIAKNNDSGVQTVVWSLMINKVT